MSQHHYIVFNHNNKLIMMHGSPAVIYTTTGANQGPIQSICHGCQIASGEKDNVLNMITYFNTQQRVCKLTLPFCLWSLLFSSFIFHFYVLLSFILAILCLSYLSVRASVHCLSYLSYDSLCVCPYV